MSQLWQIVLSVIAGVGGIGFFLTTIIKVASDIIADKLSQKYQLKPDKALEEHKSSLDRKKHISEARFDRDFAIYSSLCESFLTMVDATYFLFPNGLD
jgi:hypothetical protein